MSNTAVPKFLGRYEIVRELGKGAMGVVYEGRDPNIGRRVAIKTMRKDVMESSGRAEEMLERFLREAQAAGLLNHPNIITIYDAGEEGNTAYIAMEFVEGSNLRHMLEERKMLDPEEIVEIGATICDALAAAHDQGVVHRDVKPDNILLPTNGILKVADFGIARVSNSNLTQDGELIGTPYYMSPEQFTGQKLDGRSDLFSVAVILYEMLTGEKPFLGEALTAMMHNVINTSPIPPQKLNFNIPNPLGDVIMKALSKRPPERYADGRAMAKALRECLKPNPDPAILGLSPSASSTVMSGSGFGSGGATQIGGGQGSQMHSTLPGAPAASVLMDELTQGDSTMKTREQNTVQSPNSSGKSMMPLIAGGIALLAILAGGAFFMMGGEQKESGGEKGSVASSDIFSSVPLAPTTFYIYGTDDKELYKSFALTDTMSLTKEERGDWEDKFEDTLDDALITVTHKESGASKEFTDHIAIELPKDLSEFTIKVAKEGYVEESMDAVSFQGDQRILVVALLKDDAK